MIKFARHSDVGQGERKIRRGGKKGEQTRRVVEERKHNLNDHSANKTAP